MTTNAIVRLATEHRQQLLAEAEAARKARLAPPDSRGRTRLTTGLGFFFRRATSRQTVCPTC